MYTQSKIYNILTKGVLFLLLFSLSSCFYYRKRKVQPIPPEAWKSVILENGKENRVSSRIRIISGDSHYEMVSMIYTGDKLKGYLRPVESFEMPKHNGFREKKIPKDLRSIVKKTLYVYTDKSFEEGPVELDIKDFEGFMKIRDDIGTTLVTSVGTVILAGAATVVLICLNCPKAYVVDESGEKHFQGAMFTGAITKSRERIDLLTIETFITDQDKVSVHIANEFAEVEHLNQLELLKVKKQKNTELGFGLEAELFEYSSRVSPIEAKSIDGRDFLEVLAESDGEAYDFDDPRQGDELNTISLKFERSAFTQDKVKLLIQSRQTDWMSKTVGGFFSLYGDTYDKVIKRMDKVPAGFFEKYNAKQGISMNAYLKTDNGWQGLGSVQNVGIFKQKLMGIDLDLSEISSEEIEIKLESAFKFWEIDQVALTEDFQTLKDYEVVPMLSAINDQGQDVASLLEKIDKDYAIQDGPGTYIDLSFKHTADSDEIYVLSGSGFYYEKREFEHEKQKDALKALRSKKELAADELSRLLYEEFPSLQATRP